MYVVGEEDEKVYGNLFSTANYVLLSPKEISFVSRHYKVIFGGGIILLCIFINYSTLLQDLEFCF